MTQISVKHLQRTKQTAEFHFFPKMWGLETRFTLHTTEGFEICIDSKFASQVLKEAKDSLFLIVVKITTITSPFQKEARFFNAVYSG